MTHSQIENQFHSGYQSQIGRAAKAPGAIEELGFPGSGWIERVQSAQYNTWESAILAVCCFVVAIEEKLTPSLFSELAALLLVCRLVYPLPYALDVDLVRTQVWLTGLYVTVRAEIKSELDARGTTDRFHTGHDHGRDLRALPRDDAAALRLDAAATA